MTARWLVDPTLLGYLIHGFLKSNTNTSEENIAGWKMDWIEDVFPFELGDFPAIKSSSESWARFQCSHLPKASELCVWKETLGSFGLGRNVSLIVIMHRKLKKVPYLEPVCPLGLVGWSFKCLPPKWIFSKPTRPFNHQKNDPSRLFRLVFSKRANHPETSELSPNHPGDRWVLVSKLGSLPTGGLGSRSLSPMPRPIGAWV